MLSVSPRRARLRFLTVKGFLFTMWQVWGWWKFLNEWHPKLMLFNSFTFLLLFLPLALGGYYLSCAIGHKIAKGWLVGASLVFYGWWSPAYLVLLCGSIAVNYVIGLLIQATVGNTTLQRTILFLGISGNLALLGFYKYLFPLLHWLGEHGINLVAPEASVVLPLGISFFTFTQIGYLIDCQAGLTAGGRFLDYTLFVTFFPHLIAGPILHHREMMPQFESKETMRFRLDRISIGLAIFFIGLAKKVVIADHLRSTVNDGFSLAGNLTIVDSWTAVLAYSMQLYFDFSGYSEMALGLALLFNIRFPANFDSPYKSASIIEFWQRFHMTFTRYLNLYLYNPIALWVTRRRTEAGYPVGRQGLKTGGGFMAMVAFPTFFTMGLAGIWHGAGFNFMIFGLLHAIYLTVNHGWRLLLHQKSALQPLGSDFWLNRAWKILLTYLAVVVAQIFFRAATLPDALAILRNLTGHRLPPPPNSIPIAFPKPLILTFPLIWFAPNVLQMFAPWEPTLSKPHALVPPWLQWRPTVTWAVAMALIAAIAILSVGGATEFLYFRF